MATGPSRVRAPSAIVPWDDRLRNTRDEHRLLESPDERFSPRGANQHSSRSWLYGSALAPALREFRRFNPDDDSFDAIGDALFDWLQSHRVDRGHAYNVGYPPGSAGASISDAAYTDDLRQAGTGLVATTRGPHHRRLATGGARGRASRVGRTERERTIFGQGRQG